RARLQVEVDECGFVLTVRATHFPDTFALGDGVHLNLGGHHFYPFKADAYATRTPFLFRESKVIDVRFSQICACPVDGSPRTVAPD
ncbi:hypothetical protein, partial [Pseudomonas coronafaciens]|uniref:hypothetical protein n=1 Tax=Pseudomonas coronafaciens TaxID=53409 RepID=UPI0019678A76